MHKEGYRASIGNSYHLIHFYIYMTTVYPFNIRYIRMHRSYTLGRIWYHYFLSLIQHVNLLYLDAPFFYTYQLFLDGISKLFVDCCIQQQPKNNKVLYQTYTHLYSYNTHSTYNDVMQVYVYQRKTISTIAFTILQGVAS